MSQRIVVECDGEHFGEAVEATTVEVKALGHEFEVDLCDEHSKELRELVEALSEVGRKPGQVGLVVTACPRCGRKFPSPQALGRHAKAEHGESVNAMRGKAAASSPGRNREPGERVTVPESERVPCPECGKGFAPVGLGVHRRRAHGVKGSSKSRQREERARARDGSPSGE